ncbi:hypothetical protein QQP08_006260 [Theobroma cacao]|nr:hypothetical protein QQP08_006260 [Theobroma cacao]
MSDETRNRNDERGELKNSQEWFNFVNEMASGYIPTQGRNDRYRNGAIYNSDWNSIQVGVFWTLGLPRENDLYAEVLTSWAE